MIHLQTRCSACATEFEWNTYASLQRQGAFFIVPPLEVVRCPNCNHVSLPGETLPVLSLTSPPLNYELIIQNALGVLPDDFRVLTRYAIGNGSEFALCFMRKTFFLLFMDYDGGRLDMERVSAAVTELGAQEKAKTIASIIGATKIEA